MARWSDCTALDGPATVRISTQRDWVLDPHRGRGPTRASSLAGAREYIAYRSSCHQGEITTLTEMGYDRGGRTGLHHCADGGPDVQRWRYFGSGGRLLQRRHRSQPVRKELHSSRSHQQDPRFSPWRQCHHRVPAPPGLPLLVREQPLRAHGNRTVRISNVT